MALSPEEIERFEARKPPERPAGPTSRVIDRDAAGTAGLRLRTEEVLSPRCGEPRSALRELGPEVIPILIKLASASDRLSRSRLGLRTAAIADLTGVHEAGAPDALVALLGDRREDLSVRAHSALAAGATATPACLEALSAALAKDSSPAMRKAAAAGLRASGSLDALAPLERTLSDDADGGVRWHAYSALRGIEKLNDLKLTAYRPPLLPKGGRPGRAKPPPEGGPRPARGGRGGR